MEDPDLRDYLTTLRRQRGVVVITVVVMGIAALALSLLQTKQYQAEAELLLQRTPGEELLVDENGRVRTAQDAERQINNELRLIRSEPVRKAVADAYDGPLSVGAVTATAQAEEADIIQLRATGPDPAAVAELVNVYADTYVSERRRQQVDDLLATASDVQEQIDRVGEKIDDEQARLADLDRQVAEAPDEAAAAGLRAQRPELEGEVATRVQSLENQRTLYTRQLEQVQASAELTRSGGVQLVTPAEEPHAPASPRPARNVTVALVAGLVFGVALAFAVDRLDDSIRSKEDAEELTGLPTLGLIPHVGTRKGGRRNELVSLAEPASPTAEAHRSLRTSVKFLGVDAPIRTVLVTSATASEGKTMTAANLAVVLAQAGERVLLLDADLRRPRVHELFGAPASPGLTTLLLDEAPASAAVFKADDLPNLHVMPPGVTPPNPAELLDGERAGAFFQLLAQSYGTVVIDSPPVLPVTDAQVLAQYADAVLFVVAHHETSRRGISRALELLGQVNAPVVGTVLNRVPSGQTYSGYSYRYEAYGRRDDRRRRRRRQGRDEPGIRIPAHQANGKHANGNGPADRPAPAHLPTTSTVTSSAVEARGSADDDG